MKRAVAVLLVAAAAIVGLAPAASADPVVVVYADDQVVDLESGAGYLGLSLEDLHVTAAGVHHFLLGVAGKLADPDGGCPMNLAASVDARTGPWYVDADFGDAPSNDLVAQYYCLSPAQAAKVNVTLLIFLAGVNASQTGAPYPVVEPPSRNGLTMPALFTASFDLQITYVPNGDYVLSTFMRNGTLHLLIADMSGHESSCLNVVIAALGAADGDLPLAAGSLPVRGGTCVAFEGLDSWQPIGASDSLVLVDTGFVQTDPVNIAVFRQLPDGTQGPGFAAVEVAPDEENLADDVYFLSMTGSSEQLRRSGAMWVPTPAMAEPPRSCTQSPTTVCLSNGRYVVTSTWDDGIATGDGVAFTKQFGASFADDLGDDYLIVSMIDNCLRSGERILTVDAMYLVDYTVTITDQVTGEVREFSRTDADFVFEGGFPCP